jgi:hypothetical protein
MLALPAVALTLLAQLPQNGSGGECSAEGAQPVAKIDALKKLAPLAPFTKGGLAKKAGAELVVDEQVETYRVVLTRSARVALPLAVPPPWTGAVELALDGASGDGEPRCFDVRVVFSGDEVVRAELPQPIDVVAHARKKGAPEVNASFRAARIVLYEQRVLTIDDSGAQRTWWIAGKGGLPNTTLLAREVEVPFPAGDPEPTGSGARAYVRSLAALDEKLADDLRAADTNEARAVAFMATADELRAALRKVSPAERLAIARAIDVEKLPKELRPLAAYWRDALTPATDAGDRKARFIVDDSASEVWLDGARVFDRKAGTPTSVEVPVRKRAARVWVVFPEDGKPRVFDTTAVLRPGQIYNVGEGLFSSLSGGARSECIRVVGALPDKEPLRWRELGTPPGPLMDSNEAFRPSGAQDRREVGLVDMNLFAARVPPLPLVYSYTHSGTYEWNVSPSGPVSLRLIDDVKLCKERGTSASP